jgi:hypothetical protein
VSIGLRRITFEDRQKIRLFSQQTVALLPFCLDTLCPKVNWAIITPFSTLDNHKEF